MASRRSTTRKAAKKSKQSKAPSAISPPKTPSRVRQLDDETRYVLSREILGKEVSPVKTPLAAAAVARKNAAISKDRRATRGATAISKFNQRVIQDDGSEDSSQFESEEEELEIEEDDDEEEEESDESNGKQQVVRRRNRSKKNAEEDEIYGSLEEEDARTESAPVRLSVQAKVQRLKGSEKFKHINAVTLERVVRQFDENKATPSVIVNTSTAKQVQRRARCPWSLDEEDALERGVAKHGFHWATILTDAEFKGAFNERTQVDLKDKWRNMHKYRMYKSVPIRSYILVDENHEPILTVGMSYRHFKNRWPIDAATKAATKDYIYTHSPTPNHARIFLKEVIPDGMEGQAASVHVFDVSRHQETVPGDLPKFHGRRTAWVGVAKKVGIERLITREAVVSTHSAHGPLRN